MHYCLFTYGTLEDPLRLGALGGRRLRGVPARLPDHRCAQVKRANYPGVIWSPGIDTPGTLFCGLDLRMLRRLDRYEGSQYQRVVLPVQLADGAWCEAFVYRLVCRSRISGRPWKRVSGTQRK